MEDRSAAPGLRRWAAPCFFASGAAGLLYEVVWSKQLSYLLGSSLHATSAVVAAFLGGLALGARFLGVPLARCAPGARTYARLELGVAVLGVVLLPILRHLDPLVDGLYRALGGDGAGFAAARLALLFALLVPPAALMGATLPVLVAFFERARVGSALGRLYALNTFGAVVGSVAGGFALLPRLGLAQTTYVAASLNVGAALVAWFAPAAGAREPAAPVATDARTTRSGLAGAPYAVFALLFACSGFAALTFQIAWVRLFGLVLGSSVYSFSAVLGVYLLGLAVGSALAVRWLRRDVSLAGFAALQFGLAAATALALLAFARLPQEMFDLHRMIGRNWGRLFLAELGLVAQVVFVPCLLLGAAFPVATRLLQRRDGGHATGFAYAINTLGTIAGSLAAGFFLLPNIGVQGTHLLAVGVCALVGLGTLGVALLRREAGLRELALAAALLAVMGGAIAVAPPWDAALMSTGAYRPFSARTMAKTFRDAGGSGDDVVRQVASTYRRLYYRDGINASVLVAGNPEGTRRWLTVNGKVDASTGDMKTQVLLGLVPGALADSGARALVIGLGSGITAAGALAAGAGKTDIVELEPGVVAASRFFHDAHEDPLDDPRVTLFVADARTHLAHGRERYGLIVSEPSNPWIAGVNNLFTVDFYRRVRARLEPDGVFCQWIQMYELRPETFASMIASFDTVFPQAQIFCVWRSHDLLVIATPPGRRLSLARLSTPAARRQLERARMAAPEQLAAFYLGPIDSLRALAGGAPLNTDDRPIVEYRAPRDLVEVDLAGVVVAARFSPRMLDIAAPPAGSPFADWTPAVWAEWRASEELGLASNSEVPAILQRLRDAGFSELADRLGGELAATRAQQRAAADMANARAFGERGRGAEARAVLEQLVRDQPGRLEAWALLALWRRRTGDAAGAEQAARIAAGHRMPE